MPENYPDPTKGPYVIPINEEQADAPKAFKEFADSIPYGGLLLIEDAPNTPFTITSNMTGRLIVAKVPDMIIEFSPTLPDGFNCAIVSTFGTINISPTANYSGKSEIQQYVMGSVVKVNSEVIVSAANIEGAGSGRLEVKQITSDNYQTSPSEDANGTMLLVQQPEASIIVEGTFQIGDILNITNATTGFVNLLPSESDSVVFHWKDYVVSNLQEVDTPYSMFKIPANSTVSLVRTPRSGSLLADWLISALDNALVGG